MERVGNKRAVCGFEIFQNISLSIESLNGCACLRYFLITRLHFIKGKAF
jgi:hypothetical protein